MNLRTNTCSFLLAVAMLGCSKSEPLTEAVLPENAPCRIDVSDGGEFAGTSALTIEELAEGQRLIQFVSLAPALSGQGGFGAQITLTNEQAAALARGESVSIDDPNQGAAYPIDGTRVSRPLRDFQLAISGAVATVTMHLGPPQDAHTAAETAIATIRGQVVVSCTVRDSRGAQQGDPMLSSPFCASAKSDLGLTTWISAVR